MQYPILLGIDYGTKRVGIAVSHGTLAEPIKVIENNHQLFQHILRLVGEHQAEKIVIGLSEREMAEKTKSFVAELRHHTSLPIDFMDETLSSVVVHDKLRERHKGKRQYTGKIDHYAAAEILQDYIDTQHAGSTVA